MAMERDEKKAEEKLSIGQRFMSAFSGDASAQSKTRADMVRQNEREAELEAIRRRQSQGR